MDKGTNAALRGGWRGKVGGQTVVILTVVWYLTRNLAEGWEIDDDQYHLVVQGEPSIDTRMRLIPEPHWKNHDWDIMTALPAVSAVPQIKASPLACSGFSTSGCRWHPWANGTARGARRAEGLSRQAPSSRAPATNRKPARTVLRLAAASLR
ncbi:hypothetical protein ACFSHP_00305 [Novosphingobium panipatense]